jgi:hypothetical protein
MNGMGTKTHTNGASKVPAVHPPAARKEDLFAAIEQYGAQQQREGRLAGFRRAVLVLTQHSRMNPLTNPESVTELLDLLQEEMSAMEKSA